MARKLNVLHAGLGGQSRPISLRAYAASTERGASTRATGEVVNNRPASQARR